MTEIDRFGHPVERVRPDRPPAPPSLTADEVETIVDLVVAYTRRDPDRSMVQVWAAQSQIGRWTAAEAIRAIHLWGADRKQGEFLEPSDVTRLIRAERKDRAMRDEAARLAAHPADAAKAAKVEEVVNELASRMGWEDDRDKAAMSVECPYCHAKPRERCTGKGGRPLRQSPAHPARVDAQADARKRAS